MNNRTANSSLGFDYESKSVIFRLSVNADGRDLTGMTDAQGRALGAATVTDALPQGWEFVDIVPGKSYLLFEGAGNADGTVTAAGEPLASLAGFSPAFSGGEATFTFETLDQPYVILVKARPAPGMWDDYFSKNKVTTVRNELSLRALHWTPGETVYQDVTIKSEILKKSLTEPNRDGLGAGELRWTVEYRPYDLLLGATAIVDKLPQGIELRTDSTGRLLIEGHISAHEMNLNPDGSYEPGEAVALVEGGNMLYISHDEGDPEKSRTLTFVIPESDRAYRFSYITDVTGEPGEITNRVLLLGETDEREGTEKRYLVTQDDGGASLRRNGWIEITKLDGASDRPLEGTEFTLFAADGTTVIRQGVTGAGGKLRFKVLPVGSYILRETGAPAGYGVEGVDHAVVVETEDGLPSASIDGRTGDGSNEITVRNFEEGTVGSLAIHKSVADNGGDDTGKFEFTVTLDPAGDTFDTFTYAGDGTLAEAGPIASGGAFSLAHGEYILISGLPGGTEYTVVERDYAGDGYVTTGRGERGTIAFDERSTAEFTNTRNIGSLTITKTVAGNGGDREREFEFAVELTPPAGMAEAYRYIRDGDPEDGGEIRSGDRVTLSHGRSITITELPEGTGYTVTEADYTAEGYRTSSREKGGIIAADDSDQILEFLAEFTNTRHVGSLTIKKTVGGAAGDKERDFTFSVDLEAAGQFAYRGSKEGTIESGGEITLKDGEYVIIEGLLVGTAYEVTEKEANRDGYSTQAAGTRGRITGQGETASFVNTKRELPGTAADDLALWGLLLLGLTLALIGKRRAGKTGKEH